MPSDERTFCWICEYLQLMQRNHVKVWSSVNPAWWFTNDMSLSVNDSTFQFQFFWRIDSRLNVSDISCQKLPSKQKRRETPFPCWATSSFVWIWWREETSDIGFCHTHCSMFCVMTINLRSQADQVSFKKREIKLL